MEKVEVTILDPEAEAILDEMASKNLIRFRKTIGRSAKAKSAPADDRLAFYLSGPVMSDEEYRNYELTREWMNQWRTN